MARRSIGLPLTLGIVLVILAVALAAGWYVLVMTDARTVARGLTSFDWALLVLGTLFFGMLIAGLFWLSIWVVREMRLNQAQRAFIDAVTHELKTPLASLRLYLDTLARHDLGAERRGDFMERMREDVERLDHTVEQVLTAARSDVPGRKAHAAPVALHALLVECVDRARAQHQLPESAIRLRSDGRAYAYGDAAELAVVFRNLLENAVKYSREAVEIDVALRETGEGRIEVEIADRGIGIPSQELRKIFQRFYRAGRDVQRTAAGLGLGLFIVRYLVRRQGGRVVARSEGRGRGSRFVVSLRAAPVGAAISPETRAAVLPGRAAARTS